MRTLIAAAALALAAGGQALAADLPPPAAPPPRAPAAYLPPPPLFTWTGIYVGINGGYGFGTSTWSDTAAASGNFNANGFLVGGQLGGNYQFGQFVIGLEGDGDWTNIKGVSSTTAPCGIVLTCVTANDWLATVRGRAGYAWDRILFYGTGGAAFGNIQATTAAFPMTTLATQTDGPQAPASKAPLRRTGRRGSNTSTSISGQRTARWLLASVRERLALR